MMITVASTQDAEGEHEQMELTTLALYRHHGNHSEIEYEETEATGLEGSVTTVSADEEQTILIRRSGKTDSLLSVRPGETNLCAYDTGYGEAMLSITGGSIQNRLTGKGGQLSFRYSLAVNNALISENSVKITVKESGTDELSY